MTETTTSTVFPRRRGAGSEAPRGSVGALLEPSAGEDRIGPLPGPSSAAAAAGTPRDRDAELAHEYANAWAKLEPRGFYARYGKRALNLALLCLVGPAALVLALPIAVVNWIQFGRIGRILYCQPRVGRRGRVFSIYKFRTMREAPGDAYDSWSQGQDRLRVTRFGRLLRNTHLDELPQLLNILRGEMDFVGPRPEMVEIHRWACEHVPGFPKRNALLPGITGYAQITQGYAGKDAAAYAKKLAGDELYRRRLGLGLDLLILLRTGVWMIRGRGWRSTSGQSASGGTASRTASQPEQREGLSETSAA